MKNKIFITSDLHLFHKKINEYEKIREEKWIDSNKLLNNLFIIKKDDLLINLWDLFLGKKDNIKEINKYFQFKHWLVKWNHDRETETTYKNYFNVEKYYKKILFFENVIFIHHPYYLNKMLNVFDWNWIDINKYRNFYIFHWHIHSKRMLDLYLSNKNEDNLFHRELINNNVILEVKETKIWNIVFDTYKYLYKWREISFHYFNVSTEMNNFYPLEITEEWNKIQKWEFWDK